MAFVVSKYSGTIGKKVEQCLLQQVAKIDNYINQHENYR